MFANSEARDKTWLEVEEMINNIYSKNGLYTRISIDPENLKVYIGTQEFEEDILDKSTLFWAWSYASLTAFLVSFYESLKGL